MKTLLIDTSHRKSFIALAQDKRVIQAQLMQGGVRQSECAGALLTALLKKVGWRAVDLEQIGVGVGPGSYTGIRVGISLAKGINLVTSVPLVPFCSLTAYRPSHPASFITLFDARSGGVYLSKGQSSDRTTFGPPQALSDREALPLLTQVDLLLRGDRGSLFKASRATKTSRRATS
jgi:tRNA threonylcarbamoyladenosine biosynthesis protein TsaB